MESKKNRIEQFEEENLNNEEMDGEEFYDEELDEDSVDSINKFLSKDPGDRFLSDVFDIDSYIKDHGNKIFLIAGVGAGKSTWVKEILAKKGSVLFVTSRRAKVDEDIEQSVFDDRLNVNDRLRKYLNLVTNAKLGYYIRKWCQDVKNEDNKLINRFIDRYDYIVIDEVHSIATDSTFAESSFEVQMFMEYAVKRGKTVVAMTGTPQPVEKYFEAAKWSRMDLRKSCRYVKPRRIDKIMEEDVVEKITSEVKTGHKVIYFVNSVREIRELCKELSKIKTEDNQLVLQPKNIAVIVSKDRNTELQDDLAELFKDQSKELVQTSLDTYDGIIKEQLIPEHCKVLISSSTLREGIDIYNENVTVICDNHILSNIIQFCGRTRLSDSIFYIVTDKKQHHVEQKKVLFHYALNKEIDMANEYFWNDLEGVLKEEYVEHIESNPYIRYNPIENKYKLHFLKYMEQGRILRSLKSWEVELKNYCDEYDIINPYMDKTAQKHLALKVLNNWACDGRKIFDKGHQRLLSNVICRWLQFDKVYRQPKKMNQYLEQYGYVIESKTEKSGENRDKTYWLAVRKENVA